jgi:hypothetical protein
MCFYIGELQGSVYIFQVIVFPIKIAVCSHRYTYAGIRGLSNLPSLPTVLT